MQTSAHSKSFRRRELIVPALAIALLAAFPIVPALPAPTGSPLGGSAIRTGPAPAEGPHPVAAYSGLAVAMVLPPAPVRPGAPFDLSVTVAGGAGPPYLFAWTDSLGVGGSNRSLPLVAPSSGVVRASVTVQDVMGDSSEASASVGVGTLPSIAVDSEIGATDVGQPIPFTIEADGSPPLLALSWFALPNGSLVTSVVPAPGEVETTTYATTPGFAWIRASVTDRYNQMTSVDAVVATVHPRPSVQLGVAAGGVEVGALATVTALLTGGTPPFTWSASASLPDSNVTGARGSASASEPIRWSADFSTAGNGSVDFEISDSAGFLLSPSVSLRVAPRLAVTGTESNGSPSVGGPLNLGGEVSGGVAPFAYSIVLSDGERTDGTLLTDGPFQWTARPATPGNLSVRIAVTDAASGQANFSVRVAVLADPGSESSSPSTPTTPTGTEPPPGPTPPPSFAGTGYVGLAVLGATGALALLWVLRVRRRRRPERGPEDRVTEKVLAHLLRESDGTELSALKVLAETEGVSRSEFDSALHSLEARGRVAIDRTSEGSQLVRWVIEPSGTTPPGGPR